MRSLFKAICFLLFYSLIGSNLYADICSSGTQSYQCGEILLSFNDTSSPTDQSQLLSENSLSEIKVLNHGQIILVADLSGKSMSETIQVLQTSPLVKYAEPNYVISVNALPNDPFFYLQWALNNDGNFSNSVPDNDVNVVEVWNDYTDSSSVVVAVIDTGVDYQHRDLSANIWMNQAEIPGNGVDDDSNGYIDDVYGYDFNNDDADPMDDHGHGSLCAGIIGASGNNGFGMSGISWNAKIMALKFLDNNGMGNTADAIEAIVYAQDNGAKILNSSWGGGSYSETLYDVIGQVDQSGLLFVAAAGNDALDTDLSPHYPASFDLENIISVAAIDPYENLASFSNYGLQSVDMAAPGDSVLSTVPASVYGSEFIYMSGTSMAAPHVSGSAALLWSIYPDYDQRQIKSILMNSLRALNTLAGKTVGGGVLDLGTAIAQPDPGVPADPGDPTDPGEPSDPVNQVPVVNAGEDQAVYYRRHVDLHGTAEDPDGDSLSYFWRIYAPDGSLVHEVSDSESGDTRFRASQIGTYTAEFWASDGISESEKDSLSILVRAKKKRHHHGKKHEFDDFIRSCFEYFKNHKHNSERH